MDQVTSTGEPMDDDELEDPGSNASAPDPLIGEEPRSGALSNPAIVGSKVDQRDRVSQGRDAMNDLRTQYQQTASAASDAYAQQRKVLEQATQRLLSQNLGPSAQEIAYRSASVEGEPGTGRYDPGAHNAVQAQALKEQREAELQKQQLLMQYGMQIPQAQIGAANSRLGQITQQMRIQQSDNNNAATQVNKPAAVRDKYWTQDPNDPEKWDDHPDQRAADLAQATALAQQKADIAMKSKKALMDFQANGLVSPEMVDLAENDLKSLPSAILKSPAAMAQINQQVSARRAAAGDQAGSFWASQQANKEAAKVLDDYSKGKTHQQLDGLNTAVQHINTLRPAIDALNNGDNAWINNLQNTWNQKVMGQPAPTDYNGVRDFVVGELAKAVLPGGGGEAERQQLQASASSANSPQALRSIVDKWQELLAGKTKYAKFNWDQSTGGKFGTFEDKFLHPDTRAVLGIPPSKPTPRPGQAPAPQMTPQQQALISKWAPKPAAPAAAPAVAPAPGTP